MLHEFVKTIYDMRYERWPEFSIPLGCWLVDENNAFTVTVALANKYSLLQERHEWACKLESFLVERGITYGGADQYHTLLVYLLDGLKKSDSRVISGSQVNTTLHRRLQRVLERMRTNNVYLPVEKILELFEILLFVHDYQTSMYVVHLLKQGRD